MIYAEILTEDHLPDRPATYAGHYDYPIDGGPAIWVQNNVATRKNIKVGRLDIENVLMTKRHKNGKLKWVSWIIADPTDNLWGDPDNVYTIYKWIVDRDMIKDTHLWKIARAGQYSRSALVAYNTFTYKPSIIRTNHEAAHMMYQTYYMHRESKRCHKLHQAGYETQVATNMQKRFMNYILKAYPPEWIETARRWPVRVRVPMLDLFAKYGERMVQIANTTPLIMNRIMECMGLGHEVSNMAGINLLHSNIAQEVLVRRFNEEIPPVMDLNGAQYLIDMVVEGKQVKDILGVNLEIYSNRDRNYGRAIVGEYDLWANWDLNERKAIATIKDPLIISWDGAYHRVTEEMLPFMVKMGVAKRKYIDMVYTLLCHNYENIIITINRGLIGLGRPEITLGQFREWMCKYLVEVNPPRVQGRNAYYRDQRWDTPIHSITDWMVASLRPEYQHQRWTLQMSPRRAHRHCTWWHEDPERVRAEEQIRRPAMHGYTPTNIPTPELTKQLVSDEVLARLNRMAAEFKFEKHKIEPLITVKQIMDEGDDMHHCVGGYWHYVQDGMYFIWAITKEEGGTIEKIATLSSAAVGFTIHQLYGPQNSRVDRKLHTYVQKWLTEQSKALEREVALPA